MVKIKKAIYAFSGDPITYGHIDIVKRACLVFDELFVAIGTNPDKVYTFSAEERVEMAKKSLIGLSNVKVVSFSGTLADYAYENSIPLVIRGIRGDQDFSYELALHQIAESQKLGIDTFFIPAKQEKSHISSSAVKALQQEHGMVHEYVSLFVKQKLEEKISGQYIIGVTGEIAAGKSFICKSLKEIGTNAGYEVHHIELDHLAHQILEELDEPLYEEVRKQIISYFGKDVAKKGNYIDRKILGRYVFADGVKLQKLNNIMHEAILMRVRRDIYSKKGLILLSAALFVEAGITYLCNNNIVLVSTEKNMQKKRLEAKGFSKGQIERRIASQFNTLEKRKRLLNLIKTNNYGNLWEIKNDESPAGIKQVQKIFKSVVEILDIK